MFCVEVNEFRKFDDPDELWGESVLYIYVHLKKTKNKT